jgi:hypothetical protein
VNRGAGVKHWAETIAARRESDRRMRLPTGYLMYAALLVLLPATGGLLISMGRFGTVGFPYFWALARLGRRPWPHRCVAVTSLALLAVMVWLTESAVGTAP